MKVTIEIDPTLSGTELILRAPADTQAVRALAEELARCDSGLITVWREGGAALLPRGAVLRFFADGKGVSCQSTDGVWSVRRRLYELEEALAGARFVRVSHSEIVNLDHVTALDLSLTGTIRLTLTGGVTVWVSRRYVRKIKEVLGL